MDSFYDEPRSAPVPLSFKHILTKPVVSSPSIISNTDITNQHIEPRTSTNNAYSYEFWKQNHDRCTQRNSYTKPLSGSDKVYSQKFPTNNSFRKQVRFENYPLHAPVASNIRIKRPVDVQHRFSPPRLSYSEKNIDSKKCPLNLVPSKPFEEIYMANIPSRNLDLSMVDSNKSYINHGGCDIENLNPLNENTCGVVSNHQHLNERVGPSNCNRRVLENLNINSIKNSEKSRAIDNKITTKDFNHLIRDADDMVIDLYNYKYENFMKKSGVQLKCDYDSLINKTAGVQQNSDSINLVNKVDQSIQTQETAVCVTEGKDGDEPTVKDLLQIMKQQNEQLLLLQKQVAMLLENREKRELTEAPPVLKEIVAPPSLDNQQILPPHKINTRPLFQNPNKYSIDVMTSFEVSIRPQMKNNKFFKEHISHEPKIEEITESESNFSKNKSNRKEDLKNTNLSLALNEPLTILEQPHSPDNSIHVEMQDYSSDSDDENPVNVGWTLYNNIVGQVNQVLKKTNENEIRKDKKKVNPLQAVKEATINHLKTMGINVPIENLENANSGCDSNGSNTSNSSCSPTEISFAVKQLLMKYMPDEQLTKVATENSQEKIGNSRRPDYSFATLQYMQKYNLLTKENKTVPAQLCSSVKTNANKILDITALKQQPKLM